MLSACLRTGAFLLAATSVCPAQPQLEDLRRKQHLPRDVATAVAAGDVDGDGDVDLIFDRSEAGPAGLLLNDGAGRFTDGSAGMPQQLRRAPALTLGDVDGDGDLDLLLASWGGRDSLFLNDGTGRFTDVTATQMPNGREPTRALALGDVDADGDLDLVTGNAGTANRLYLNDGAGAYTNGTSGRLPTDSDDTRAVVLGDVDGDGDLDLVTGNGRYPGEQNRVYLNSGAGSFTEVPAALSPPLADDTEALALADVDSDGDLDLVVGNEQGRQDRLYLNDGSGAFVDVTTQRLPPSSSSTYALGLADVDGDGDCDLVLGLLHRQNLLYANDGTGTFTDVTGEHMPIDEDRTRGLAIEDLDGDGDVDVALANAAWSSSAPTGNRGNALYLNDGTGHFRDGTEARMLLGDDSTRAVALGDVDGDGDYDLVFGNEDGQNRLLLNSGTGAFVDATAARLPVDTDQTRAVAMGDVDGDGDIDLVFGNRSQQSHLYLNDGTGSFTAATAGRLPIRSDATRALALVDVDGDGDRDLVIANEAELNRLYLNDGDGVFVDVTESSLPQLSSRSRSLATGDVDGDGSIDLLFGNYNQLSRLLLNNGSGVFTDATASSLASVTATSTRAVALADLDSDGDVDLILGTLVVNSLYLNDGAGVFTDATAAKMPSISSWTDCVATGDIDDDGDIDLFFGTSNSLYSYNSNLLFVNAGNATFVDATAARLQPVNNTPGAAVFGDVDGDADLDLVMANIRDYFTDGPNRLLINHMRQLEAPYVVKPGQSYQLDGYARHGLGATTDVMLPFLSTGTARIPLPPFGTFGLDPTQLLVLPLFDIPQPAGTGSLTIPIPNLPVLGGLPLYTQALLVPSAAAPRLTNVTADALIN